MLVIVIMARSTGRGKLAIEFLLLLRGQQRANLVVGRKNKLLVLAVKILVQFLHFDMRIAQQVVDLMKLVRA